MLFFNSFQLCEHLSYGIISGISFYKPFINSLKRETYRYYEQLFNCVKYFVPTPSLHILMYTISVQFARQSDLPWSIPRNLVESDLRCTSRIYFDDVADNVTMTLHNVTLTSQKPCQHNNKCGYITNFTFASANKQNGAFLYIVQRVMLLTYTWGFATLLTLIGFSNYAGLSWLNRCAGCQVDTIAKWFNH